MERRVGRFAEAILLTSFIDSWFKNNDLFVKVKRRCNCLKRNIAFAIIAICIIATPLAVLSANQLLVEIPSEGEIITPATLTVTPSYINWDTLYRGNVTSQTVLLKNTGTQPTKNLNVSASPTVGTLANNITGVSIPGNSSIVAEFTLTVDSSAPIGYFDFPIIISEIQ